MNRTEHLITIVAEEASEIAKEANLLIERIHNPEETHKVLTGMSAAFLPLWREYVDLTAALNKVTGKPMDQERINMRIRKARKDFDKEQVSNWSSLNRILAQISIDALDAGARASKAVRFGLAEIQPEQTIPYSNQARMLSACADLIGIIGYAIECYNLEFEQAEFDRLFFEKGAKIERFLEHSVKCGTLQFA